MVSVVEYAEDSWGDGPWFENVKHSGHVGKRELTNEYWRVESMIRVWNGGHLIGTADRQYWRGKTIKRTANVWGDWNAQIDDKMTLGWYR